MKTKVIFLFFVMLPLFPFAKEKAKRPIVFFTIGDSTMADKTTEKSYPGRGWGQMLHCFLTDDVVVENHAADGRSSLSFIQEGRWEKVLQRLKKGDYVFIQFGHNDEKPAKELHTEPGSTFDENLSRFVRETRAKGAFPILMNSIVRRNFPPEVTAEHKGSYEKEGNVLVDTHGDYLLSPEVVAKKMNVPFINMNKLTHEWVMAAGVEPSRRYFMWIPKGTCVYFPEGNIDNTHLSIEGAEEVARIAIEAVAEVAPDLKPYIRYRNPWVYVANYKGDKTCAISYTFDDGLQEHFSLLYPHLEKLGFKATFWVCGKIIEYKEAQLGKPRMTWEQMKEMSLRGHEISNHSWSHPVLTGMREEDIEREVSRCDSMIELKIGERPVTFCYPGNLHNDKVVRIVSKDRVATRLTQYAIGGEVSKTTAEKLDTWVNNLLVSKAWGVAMVHGITKGYDCFPNKNILWQHFDWVKEHEKDIWISTFRQIGAYEKERNNTILKVRKKKSGYRATPVLTLDCGLFKEPLTMVVKQQGNVRLKVKQAGRLLPVEYVNGKALFEFDPFGGEIVIENR